MNVLPALRASLELGEPAILVTVTRAEGSTPREAGAAMLVTRNLTAGTVGGGALELEAVLEARRMIADGLKRSALDIPLGPAIGQCCGGRVQLHLERADNRVLARLEAERLDAESRQPTVLVFGAGHTGQAIARALTLLPFQLTIIDGRSHFLAELPAHVTRIASAVPEQEIDRAEPGTAFVVVTHDHALDFLLAARALERGDAAYVGMIGSATKRQKFRSFLRDTGSDASPSDLTLPIGGTALRDKRPEVIAALVAAELLIRLSAEPAGQSDRPACKARRPLPII